MGQANLAAYERAPRTAEIAAYFAGVLRGWLTDHEWAEMRRLNTEPGYVNGDACASHNYCDANMAMDAAWIAVVGRHPDASSDADATLWNAAWSLASRKYLTGQTTHACEYCDPAYQQALAHYYATARAGLATETAAHEYARQHAHRPV